LAHVLNDPEAFVEEATEGFVAAHSLLIRQVQGGVVRNQNKNPGEVAVIVGGGSGHYPAFAGVVGPGLAHGAVIGNVFASPSSQRVLSVCKEAESGGGVLLTYGNYAGDVMNFNLAQEQLNNEGIPCKTVLVTDDIMSASKEEFHKRRGIAGGLVVFKLSSAAAEAGYSLDEVFRIATETNARTRTVGVAFSGCTLPGKDEPLFTIPTGKIALGLGIHGEPGLSESDIPTSENLAIDLINRLLDETPPSTAGESRTRLAVLVNGLGGVKYEELFVFYNNVSKILKAKNIEIVEPEVGELVTSFEMAGLSLTFTWLNDELSDFWKKPSYTPGYKKGNIAIASGVATETHAEKAAHQVIHGSSESQKCAQSIAEIIKNIELTTAQHSDEYGRLDSFAGDGDHGIGMARGAHAASVAAQNYAELGAGAGSTLLAAADAWSDKAGGTSGIIWGIILREIGEEIGDEKKPDLQTIINGVERATRKVTEFGKAQLGDKTLVDVLLPFTQTLSSTNSHSISDAWRSASSTASDAAKATADLLPKIGRARPHAEKSLGHQDPGATSLAMIIDVVANYLEKAQNG
jgi:dihydroxyacetone kinase